MKTIRFGAFQFRGSNDIEKNLDKILYAIDKAAEKKVHALALQECALSGYAGLDIKSCDEIDQKALKQATDIIKKRAADCKMYVSLGTTTFKNKEAYNSLMMINPKGKILSTYNKRAMYIDDYKYYTPGNNCGKCTKIESGRIAQRICFDFRFPEYFRELIRMKADVVMMGFCMVGTNDKKFKTGKAHLMSRAAENCIYIVTANNTRGIQNCPTCIISPEGEIISQAPLNKESLIYADLTIPFQHNKLTKCILSHARNLQK